MTPRGPTFWMVCAAPSHPGSKTEPKLRYPHRDAALQAARDLAYQNDRPFVVLEAVEVIHPKDRLTKGFNFS